MLRAGQVIVICVFALLTLGVVMVTSAGMTIDPKAPVTVQSVLLSRSTIYMALALLAMGVVALAAPVRWLARVDEGLGGGGNGWRMPLLWAGVVTLIALCAVVYLPGVGAAKKGSHRWLELHIPGLGAQSVQPSEFAKWGMVLLMAFYAASMGSRLGRFFTGLLPGLVALGAVAGFVVLEDLGTGVLIGAAAVVTLLAGGARFWHFAMMVPVGLAGFVAAVLAQPYRMKRVTSFLDPYQDPLGTGFHMIQSMVAVANGQIFGRGLGHGLQKFGYLPEDTTDFLFAIICEELGLFGAVLVVSLYAGLLWAGVRVVRKQTAPMLKLLGLGVITTVGVQAAINLAVVTGLGPTKGIALPLLSSGGTGWIMTAASLGLLVAMDRLNEEQEALAPEALAGAPTLAQSHAAERGEGGVDPSATQTA
jgi:cell division protein FtsW